MAMALNVHFDCCGPDKWHFVRKKSADGDKKSLTQLRAEARLWNQPAWVASYLCDVVKSRGMNLCKKLPRVDSFFLTKEEKQNTRGAKRQRIDDKGESAYETKPLSATLWSVLGITTSSLSHNIRPGAKPR